MAVPRRLRKSHPVVAKGIGVQHLAAHGGQSINAFSGSPPAPPPRGSTSAQVIWIIEAGFTVRAAPPAAAPSSLLPSAGS